ncbi:SAM-dependent methyltransferase [Allokutzneria multivorans]|uniref:SAM-dependent methyltransferase n=1 Tax=Allokutzneria multivorans TaxID=1142134 RepID=UPI0031E82A1F
MWGIRSRPQSRGYEAIAYRVACLGLTGRVTLLTPSNEGCAVGEHGRATGHPGLTRSPGVRTTGCRLFPKAHLGIPRVSNVHEVARKADPGCRIVRADGHPVTFAHGPAGSTGGDRARTPASGRVVVAHSVPDFGDPVGSIRTRHGQVVPGSVPFRPRSAGEHTAEEGQGVSDLYRMGGHRPWSRECDSIALGHLGFELVEQGVVFSRLSRPDSQGEVGKKPERSGSHATVGLRI